MAGIASVIKYEGDNTTFIWKHPNEDFNIGSQLIVHESQEAIFFMNGQALDLFGPGRHTLTTLNLPLIGKFFNLVMGGESPFHCEVYFINKTEQMAIKWGTDTKVEYIEPVYQFPIKLGASGEMNLRAEDSRKLLVKVVGTEKVITQQMVVQKFRAFLMTKLKTYIAQLIKKDSISVFEVDAHLTEMSDALHTMLKGDFEDYGITLERFFVTTIVKPEEDKSYQKFKDLHFRLYADVAEAKIRQQVGIIDQQTQSQRMVIEAEGLAQKRTLEGFTYQQERGFDVAEGVAKNEAVGGYTNAGMGLGMMMGVGSAVGGAVGGVVNETMNQFAAKVPVENKPESEACKKCGSPLPQNAKFCLECGEKVIQIDEAEIICAKCGAKTPKGKFCIECGATLIIKCISCGAEIPPGGKFCLECGMKIGGN